MAAEYCGQVVNPVHLKTLLEVTRLGSFAAAASTLGYTASAVSQQMSALERDTGVVLFQRSARSVVPTEAAVVMTRHAAKVLTDMEALMAAASKTQDSANQELRLGIFPSLATYVLPRILKHPAWKNLGIDLKVSVAEPGQTIQGLRTGGDLDLAVVFQVGQTGFAWPNTINRQWIGDDNFRVVLPAGWVSGPMRKWPRTISPTCHGSCTTPAPAMPWSSSASSRAATCIPGWWPTVTTSTQASKWPRQG
jgi:DNA-binding transcriptional LysR family regulator